MSASELCLEWLTFEGVERRGVGVSEDTGLGTADAWTDVPGDDAVSASDVSCATWMYDIGWTYFCP